MSEPDAGYIPLDEANRVLSPIASLPMDSAVRHVALRLLRGEQVTALGELKGPLLNPAGASCRAREVAAWALGHAQHTRDEADTASALLLHVFEEVRSDGAQTVFRRSLLYSAALTFAGFILVGGIFDGWPRFDEGVAATIFFYVSSLPFTAPVAWWVGRRNNNRVRAAAATTLGNLGCVDAIGLLAAAIYDRDRAVRSAAESALHRLLPLLGPEYLGQFGAETMHHLGRALSHRDVDLAAKVLAALEHVGTSHALPFVMRAVREGRTLRLREQADYVRSVLEERRARETASGRLLRPSTTPGQPADLLMRPARAAAEREVELLLKPAGDDLSPG